jgi:hypothetical protein
LTFESVCRLAESLPGIERATSYGTASLKVRGKFLARLKEDGATMVLRTAFVVRDHLLRTVPDAFFVTDHYRDYPAVLVRLENAPRDVIAQLLEDAWRAAAPKRLVRAHDEGRTPP